MNPFEFSFSFNNRIISSNESSPVYNLTETLFGKYNQSKRLLDIRKIALNNILSNLIIAHTNGRYLIISKSSNEYSSYSWYGLNHYTYRLIIGWIELLIKEGYIKQVLGFYDPETETGKRTRLFSGEKLISSLSELRNNVQEFESLDYNPSVILKDKDKKRISYSIINRLDMIKSLNEYNEFISGFNIELPLTPNIFQRLNSNSYPFFNEYYINPYHIMTTQVVIGSKHVLGSGIPLLITLEPNFLFRKKLQVKLERIFNNGKFTEGGRFYKASYQQLNEKDRAKIEINNSPVVEVDYSSFHLNMLYHTRKIEFNEDPYLMVINNEDVRPILKLVCLIAINSSTPTQALRALKDEIRKNPELEKLKRVYHLDEANLLRKFESVHFEISNYFYSGIGIKLQYLDSQIAHEIFKYFMSRDIPCLGVHDSFIVPANHKEELKEVMNKTYKKHLGFDAKLK